MYTSKSEIAHTAHMVHFPIRLVLLWFAAILLLIVLAAAGVLFFLPSQLLQHVIGSKGTQALNRSFSVDGPITINWDWTTPQINIAKIRVANLPESKDPNMVAIDNLSFHIKMWKLLEGQLNLPDITIDKPRVVLEEIDPDHKNWEFSSLSGAGAASSAALPSHRGNFPILGLLTIHDGELIYRNAPKGLDVKLNIDTANAGGGEKGMFTISGNGALQGKTFEIKAQGGSLSMLRETNIAYPMNLNLNMGATHINVDGTFTDPVKMEGIDTKLDLRGDNLADLFYLTEIPLPPTPVYQLTGHLLKKGDVWTFEGFNGKVGSSDLEGNLSYNTSGERGYMQAALNSQHLDVKDLGGFIGAKPKPTAAAAPETNKDKENKRLLPDMPLNLTRLRATDLDVDFRAAQLIQPGLPMNDMHIGFHLKDGVLQLDPFDVGVANGKISGNIVLDGSQDIPHVQADLALSRLSLKQFFENTQFASLAEGFIGGHFKLDGSGRSLAEVLASGNGRTTVVMTGGTISQLIISAAGLDVGHATKDLLDGDKPTGIRCAVGDFNVRDGMLNSNVFVFDTTASNINGAAHINLKDESIDVKVEANPKHTSIAAGTPITVTGHLASPSIGLDPKEEGARVGAAAVMGAFLTPLAAIIPFIELGLGKNSDCQSLIDETRSPVK